MFCGLQAVLAELDLDRPIATDHLGVAARGDQHHSRQKEGELRCAQPCHGDAIMIPPSMSRPVKVLFIAAAAVVASTSRRPAAPRTSASRSPAPTTRARCCSTSAARAVTRSPTPRTHGSAPNARNRRDRQRAQLRPALRTARRPRALRDPERRLLGRDHAPEHRRGPGCAQRRELRRHLLRAPGAQGPGRDPVRPAADRHAPGPRNPTATTATTGTTASTTAPSSGTKSADDGQGRQGQEEELQLLVSVARPPTRSGRPFSTSS